MNFSFQLWKVWEKKLKLKKSFVKKEKDSPGFPLKDKPIPSILSIWQTEQLYSTSERCTNTTRLQPSFSTLGLYTQGISGEKATG